MLYLIVLLSLPWGFWIFKILWNLASHAVEKHWYEDITTTELRKILISMGVPRGTREIHPLKARKLTPSELKRYQESKKKIIPWKPNDTSVQSSPSSRRSKVSSN